MDGLVKAAGYGWTQDASNRGHWRSIGRAMSNGRPTIDMMMMILQVTRSAHWHLNMHIFPAISKNV